MKLDNNLFAFTAFLIRNQHVETESKLKIDDGYEWYNYIWNKWLINSDEGENIMKAINNSSPDATYTEANLKAVTFTFTQRTNCVDGPTCDIETLVVEAKSSLGIDGDGGAFYVLRTEQWAIDSSNEINEIIKRCEKAISSAL
jgi:hypothetical protein